MPSDLKLATSRLRPSRSSSGSAASAAPPVTTNQYPVELFLFQAKRTWLVSNTAYVESLVAGEEGIALYGDGWQVSL